MISRRNFLTYGLGLATSLLPGPFDVLALPPAAAAPGDSVTVTTPLGRLAGRRSGNVNRFLGIPFAAPPVGPLRFMPPQPPKPWRGMRDAARFASAPMQIVPAAVNHTPLPLPVSEDCLYLNIWTPSAPGNYPVFVWIHGGGNSSGSTRMSVFDGAAFAESGIVCVTITYRVGMFGFLELGEILGPDYSGSSNNGLRDIILALRWVHDNIDAFNGDPDAVTVGGQSAGGKNVAALLAIAEAQGLFRRAVLQSGGGQTTAPLEEAREFAESLVRALHHQMGPGDSRSRLIDSDAESLLPGQAAAVAAWPVKYPFRAITGDSFLPQDPVAGVGQGSCRHIPLLVGTTRHEAAFWGPPETSPDHIHSRDLANMTPDAFRPFYERYAAAFPEMTELDRTYLALSAEEYGIPTLRLAEAQSSAGGEAYLYRFDMGMTQPGARRGYAIHGAELPLIWKRMDDPMSSILGPEGPEALTLSALMHEVWCGFIRSGKPGGGALPHWPAYDRKTRSAMQFAETSRTVPDLAGAERKIWESWKPV